MKERKYKIEGCFVDDNKRFAFIHIYKNASISMRNALNIRGKYAKFSDVLHHNPTTICIIRNPVTRLVSAYQYLLRLEDNGFPEQHPIEITRNTDFYRERKDPIKSFLLFLKYIEDNGFYDAVTLPQIEFLRDRNIEITDVDEVLVQERIGEDFLEFKKKYNLPEEIEFPEDNTSDLKISTILKSHVTTNKITLRRIFNIYKEDVKIYLKYERKR